MKDLKIEYRDGKLIHLSVDGVEMTQITSVQFSHAVGEDVPSLALSGHLISGLTDAGKQLERVEKISK